MEKNMWANQNWISSKLFEMIDVLFTFPELWSCFWELLLLRKGATYVTRTTWRYFEAAGKSLRSYATSFIIFACTHSFGYYSVRTSLKRKCSPPPLNEFFSSRQMPKPSTLKHSVCCLLWHLLPRRRKIDESSTTRRFERLMHLQKQSRQALLLTASLSRPLGPDPHTFRFDSLQRWLRRH